MQAVDSLSDAVNLIEQSQTGSSFRLIENVFFDAIVVDKHKESLVDNQYFCDPLLLLSAIDFDHHFVPLSLGWVYIVRILL